MMIVLSPLAIIQSPIYLTPLKFQNVNVHRFPSLFYTLVNVDFLLTYSFLFVHYATIYIIVLTFNYSKQFKTLTEAFTTR